MSTFKAAYLIKAQSDNKTFSGLRTVSRNTEADMAEGTSQDSTNQWKEFIPLYKNQTYSLELVVNPEADGISTVSRDQIYDYIAAGTKFTMYYGGIESGDTFWTQDAYISSLGETNDYGDIQTISVEIQGTGEPTKDTVS